MNSIINRLLNSKIINKNIAVTLLLLILIGLNLLGIDIEYISQSDYLLTVLIVVNIFITVIMYPMSSLKIKSLDTYLETVEELKELVEETKEDYELTKSKMTSIDSNFSSINSLMHTLYEEIKGVPNIKMLKLLLELRTRGLWNEIFRECLKFVLTSNRDNMSIMLSTYKNNIDEIVSNYLSFVKINIHSYDVHELLTEEIKTKINLDKENIYNELTKDKKAEEKMYIISLLLKSLQDDIDKISLEYLRTIQANIIQ